MSEHCPHGYSKAQLEDRLCRVCAEKDAYKRGYAAAAAKYRAAGADLVRAERAATLAEVCAWLRGNGEHPALSKLADTIGHHFSSRTTEEPK